MGLYSLLTFLVVLVTAVIVISVSLRKRNAPTQQYMPPYQQQPPMMPPYPQQQMPYPAYPPQQVQYPPQQAPAQMPPGYQPRPTDQAVTAANGYQLLIPQFGPQNLNVIISVAVVAQGKVFFRAMPNGTGVFRGGLDLVSGRRQAQEDALTTVRRVLAEETGGWTGRPIATVGYASWDLGNGKETDICYAVLLDLPPNGQLPAAGMGTWAAKADLPQFRDLGPRAQMACKFAEDALSACGF
ncbi:hypothetical protein [Actinocrispum sp. NPDC049592]|uniref:NUDIX hydrolase n=1 Tax=Actinocrispum sp. NPDC049592 TaxID=3154835 RepID=UPI00343ED2B9